jgi:hypothetical protein
MPPPPGALGRNEPDQLAARPEGYAPSPRERQNAWCEANVAPEVQEEIDRPPAFSDEALAMRFAERRADNRYVAAKNKWVDWNGRVWRFGDTLYAFDLARRACREAAPECNKPKTAAVVASAKIGRRATSPLRSRDSRASRAMACRPLLLNTPDGVLDLRSGKTRAHHSTDYPDPGRQYALRRAGGIPINDRLSFMRFMGLGLSDRVPDAGTILDRNRPRRRQQKQELLVKPSTQCRPGLRVKPPYAKTARMQRQRAPA